MSPFFGTDHPSIHFDASSQGRIIHGRIVQGPIVMAPKNF
jgi:hypothetical protein